MKESMTWFWTWEKSIWKEKIGANRYFATLSVLFAALVGACVGGGNTLHNWFDWELQSSALAVSGLLLYVWSLNLAESILAAEGAAVAVLRALLVTVCLAAAYGIGYLGSIVILVLIAIWVSITVLGAVFSVLSSIGESPKNANEFILEDGTRVKKRTGLFGEASYSGSDGHSYDTDDDGYTFYKK